MANNKVALSTGEVLIDLTQDDVKPEHVQDGIYFHDKTGVRQKGSNKKTVDASEATAEAAEVLKGRTFGKGEELQVGTMPDNSGKEVIISDKDGTPLSRGYYDESSTVKLSEADRAKLIPENIKEGVTILGVPGTFGTDDFSAQTKQVTPKFGPQIVNPDPGYAFLSAVEVGGIPVTRTDNEFGGTTVTIGPVEE